MLEQEEMKKSYGQIPNAIILLGAALLIGLVPYLPIVSFIIALVAVILILAEHSKMSSSEGKPFYFSIVAYFLSIGVALVGVIASLGTLVSVIVAGQQPTPADLQRFIIAFIPYLVATAIFSQLAYLLLPYGLAERRERIFLYIAFVVTLALSITSVALFYTGYYHLTSIPSSTVGLTGITATSGLSNSLTAKLMGIPGAVLMAAAYFIIGRRLRKPGDTTSQEMQNAKL